MLRRSRAWTWTGAALVAVGAGLASGSAVLLIRRNEALDAMTGLDAALPEYGARYDELADEAARDHAAGIAFAATGGALVAAGVIAMALDARGGSREDAGAVSWVPIVGRGIAGAVMAARF